MRCFISFLFLLFTYHGLAQTRQLNILRLETERFKAMINKDSIKLDKILANDLLYIHSNGMIDSKTTLIRNIMTGKLEYLEIDVQQSDIRTHSQTAWIHGSARVKVRNGINTPEVEFYIRYLDIYKKHEGTWQLVAWQSARLN